MHTRFGTFLVLALAVTPLIGETIGPLTSSGNVWTNQIAVPSGSSLYAGDVIKTDDHGVAVIGNGQRRTEVRPESEVTLHENRVDLHRGSVGASHAVIQIDSAQVSSLDESRDSWFVVSDVEGQTIVAAYLGDAEIIASNGHRTVVPAGSFAMAAASPRAGNTNSPRANDDDDNDKGAAPAGAKGSGGWSIKKIGPATAVLIATGGAAAALTGFAVTGDDLRDTAVSPQ